MASIEELKAQIDLHDLAEKLGLERPQGRGNYRSPHHQDNNPSLSIRNDGRGWRDYSASDHDHARGDCVDLVMYVEGMSEIGDAVRRLHEIYGIPSDRPQQQGPRREKSIPEFIAERSLANATKVMDYLTGRGISEDAVTRAIKRGTVGFNDWTSEKRAAGEVGHGGPAAAFIVRSPNPGRVLAVDLRYLDPELNGGVKTQTQGQKEGALWCSDWKRFQRAKTVYVVESPVNVLSIDTVGKADWAAVATRGTGTVETIDWRLLMGKRVVICMDNDPPNERGHCPGDAAGWRIYELLTGLNIAAHLVDQAPWVVEGEVEFNDVNDVLQEGGVSLLRGYLQSLQPWAIPGVRGDDRRKKNAKARLWLPEHDFRQYSRFRAKEDFTTYVKKWETEDSDEPQFGDLCGFRVASISRIRVQSATATMSGEKDNQPNTLFAVSVQTPRHGNQLIRRVFEDERLHNLDQWGKFGPVFAKAQFSRMVTILERAAHLGSRDAVNFVGLAWRDGRPTVNEGPDCYFTEPDKQCPYHSLTFPTGDRLAAQQVIQAYQRTFQHNAAMIMLTWTLGAHLKAYLGFWPHLVLQADKGAGKSTLVKRLERTTAMTMFSGQSLQTEFRMLTSISHTSHPVGWEEISARRQDVIDKAVSLLQESYQHTVTRRGSEMTEYLISAPVLLAGEDVPVRSLLGKVVRTELTGRKGEILPEDLPRFPMREWLRWLAECDRKQIAELYDRARRKCLAHSRASGNDDGALRMSGNYAALATAWKLLSEFADIPWEQGDFLDDLYGEMNRHIAETSSDREPWVWILEAVLAEIAAGNYRLPVTFAYVDEEECLLLRASHVMHHLKTTISLRQTWDALPVKSDRVLKKQLINAGVVHTERLDKVIGNKREHHLMALSLRKLEEYGLEVSWPALDPDD